MALACALHFRKWVLYALKKILGSCRSIQKHVFKSVELKEENDQRFLLRFQLCLQKKVSALAACYERCQRRQVELITLLYYGLEP